LARGEKLIDEEKFQKKYKAEIKQESERET
jgi:hypothetical protein